MEFRVLGPVELWSAGRQLDLGRVKERCVLAILLLTPRTPVPAEVLIDRIWDTAPPARARADLSAYVSRIRRRIQHVSDGRARLGWCAGGYVLDIAPECVDVHQFQAWRRQARAKAASGEAAQAVMLLRDADALWRGAALAGLAGGWMARMRTSLEEERRGALLERVELELALGRHADLVGELHQLSGQYGLDEAFIACHLTALHRCGRLADALAAYAQARRRLIDEQGTEPGPELAELHQRILRRDPGLAVPAARHPPACPPPGTPPAAPAPPDTLPPGAAEFVGRAGEILRLTGEPGQPDGPVIKIIEGMPGIGKTALAIHAARADPGRYPSGRYYVSYHAHDPGHAPLDAPAALHALLRTLGIPAAEIPATLGERAARWRAELARRRAVIVLDDVPGPEQVRPVLPTTGGCMILITSRAQLPGIACTGSLTLAVLPGQDAVDMFTQIAGRERAQDAKAAAEAVRLCGHLPLAIKLAAARLREQPRLSLPGLVAELSPLPGDPEATSAASPQVTQAFELSYLSLSSGLRRSFRRLGVLPCADITPYAAAALDATTLTEAEHALAALAARHLLEKTAAGRFRCHDLVRAYAMSRALREDPRPQRRQAVTRLLDYYLHTAHRADRMLYPHRRRGPVPAAARAPAAIPALGTTADARAWLETERRNIVQAVRHAAAHEWKRQCADLAHLAAGFLDASGNWDDALAVHELALRACRDLDDPRAIAQACLDLSHASQQTGRYPAATRHAEEAAAIYRSLADRHGEAEALDRLGTIHDYSARFPHALAYYQEARSAYRDAGDRRGVADTLAHAGIVCWCLGRHPEAARQLGEALTLYRLAGDRRGEAKTLNNLGEIQRHRGYHRDAARRYREALAIFGELGDRQSSAVVNHNIGMICQYKGDCEQALACYRRALTTYRDTGDRRNQAGVLNDIGIAFQSMEHSEQALTHHEQALAIAEQIGDRYEQAIALRGIADARRCTGHYAEALDRYHSVLKLAREIGDPYQEAKILGGIADAVLPEKGREAARIYWRQALDIFQRLGVPEAQSAKLRLQTLGAQAS